MDTQSFASLAQIRIILLPVGSIRRATFDKWAAEIRAFEDIRLGDIPADTRDDRARFMPSPLSAGHLHLSFPVHPPPSSHAPLSLFRPSHFPLGVIGIADCSQSDALSSKLAQFNAMQAELFPSGSAFPLARNCFVFEEGDGNADLNIGDHLSGLVVIPSMMGNKRLYIGTLLAELCSNILGEFSIMVKTLESTSGNDYLNARLFPNFPPPLSELRGSIDVHDQSRNSLPPLPSQHSQPELSTSTSSSRGKLSSPLSLKRNPSTVPGNSAFRSSSLGVPPVKKRQSGASLQAPHGRLYKLLGDFFLLAGRTVDAVIWYNEAIALFKLPQDSAWHASALEGIVTAGVLDAWTAGHGLNTSANTIKEPWAELTEKLLQAITLYSRASPATESEQEHSFLAYLYVTAVLQHASLLFSVWSAKGWGPLAFTAMLHPGPHPYIPPTLLPSSSQSTLYLDRMSSIAGIPRSEISAVLTQAHGPWLLHLGPRERIGVLETMARMYSCLGYKRKEAYILREILGCIMDLIVCGRGEGGGPTPVGTATVGLGINDQSLGEVLTNERGQVGVREKESTAGNESVLQLVKYVCGIHGINLDAVKFLDEANTPGRKGTRKTLSEVEGNAANDLASISSEVWGWPELQIGIVREALAVAEALPDHSAVAIYTLSALKNLHPVLEADDQYHLHTASARALSTAHRRGDDRRVEYWSSNPVVSIEVTPLSFVRIPIERPSTELHARPSDVSTSLVAQIDPFLYNPRRSQVGKRQTLVVQNENLDFVVTLRNPFAFVLELQQISLSTSGVSFESKGVPTIIPSNSFHQITLSGTALEAGILVVRGCTVQVSGGAPHEFVLPLLHEEDEEKRTRRRSALTCEAERSKYSGLNVRLLRSQTQASEISPHSKTSSPPVSFSFLELKVVPEQPLLRIRRTSLTHGAVMLYNGETSTIRLTLENVSAIPIDFLKFTFDDSTIAPAEQALADGDLSIFDTYETEHNLIHRPVFSWDVNNEFKEMLPGKESAVTITCLGKAGCTNGMIQLVYSYTQRRQQTLQRPAEVFHTRQLLYPVLVTVYQMLECHGMDIVPFSRMETTLDEIPEQSLQRKAMLSQIDDSGWSLFTLDVRNTYGLPFEVTFVREEGGVGASLTEVVAPGSTHRFIIPVKRFSLPEYETCAPIPTLTDRQFVVSKSHLTSEEEKIQRELFWYRENLFRRIKAQWQEAGGARSGELSLRSQRLTLPMLNALRTEMVRVKIMILSLGDDQSDDKGKVKPIGSLGTKYLVPTNRFVCLRTQVTNISSSALVLVLTVNTDPPEHIIYDGVLSDIPIGRLESNESRSVDIVICFLAEGQFDVSSQLRIVGVAHEDSAAGIGQVRAIVREP